MSFIEIEEDVLDNRQRFYGKYRATVVNNIDPKGLARIQVLVPDVSTTAISSWAMPCLPWGGMQAGLFTVPLIGAGVWVEFEQGDPDFPIWTGCYWGSPAETPAAARQVPPAVPGFTIQSPSQNVIQISDLPGLGGILLRTRSGAMISINDLGITINNGKGAAISMLGNTVDINNGALTVV
jgi:uncharacterized protein involved in type VI secretion and phage assembly